MYTYLSAYIFKSYRGINNFLNGLYIKGGKKEVEWTWRRKAISEFTLFYTFDTFDFGTM